MVRGALVVVALLAGAAHADVLDEVPKLGMTLGYGPAPVEHVVASTTSLGLALEHPTFRSLRTFAEWEWLWLSNDGDQPMLRGSGQRVAIGVRRAVFVTSVGSHVRIFIDGELGGGAMLTTSDAMGEAAQPMGFAGIRFGYDFRNGDSSSRVLELDVSVRQLVLPTGYGIVAGFGLAWGD